MVETNYKKVVFAIFVYYVQVENGEEEFFIDI